jgi:hypothetical protein
MFPPPDLDSVEIIAFERPSKTRPVDPKCNHEGIYRMKAAIPKRAARPAPAPATTWLAAPVKVGAVVGATGVPVPAAVEVTTVALETVYGAPVPAGAL